MPEAVDYYVHMRWIREFEAKCLELSREGVIEGSIHLCAGQEAIPVGFAGVLQDHDSVFATYRGHGWAMAAGVSPTSLLAEICHRGSGTNAGRAGSAFLSPSSGKFKGENSIVGAAVSIAAGAALAAVSKSTGGVAVVSIGDGAMNQGSVTEALVFASTRNLPLVVVCENNGWAEMTPTSTMMRGENLVDRAAGLGITHRIVDGRDPHDVATNAAWALEVARSGGGPVFLECKVSRLWGHYNKDIEHYRPSGDKELADANDPLNVELQKLVDSGSTDVAALEAIDESVRAQIEEIAAQVMLMPTPDARSATTHVVSTAVPTPTQDADMAIGVSTRLTYQRAANAALAKELENRPNLLVYGEDIAQPGGVFGVTRGLQKRFGDQRVFDTPIAENAILGSAFGAAISGMRPVVEIMWADFLLVALDQLINQAANARYVSSGMTSAPMVVRTQQGATPGSSPQHSQSLEALLAHIPGLKVGMVANATDAYSMLRAAIADDDPCILFESRAQYQEEGDVFLDGPLEPAAGGRTVRQGDGPAIISWGSMVGTALEAASRLAQEGIEVSVHNLRWVSPIDDALLAEAVKVSGGRVLVAHEANVTGGVGGEVAARIQSAHFTELAMPVKRLGALDSRIPASPALQAAIVPTADAIVRSIRQMLGWASEPVRS
ncbi:2-oxoisovalerate dehydrogenase E1 component [Cryobacterium mesophilum]|uniref:dihydrolipoyllysine-residue succinyltransferase n=1 Tax=Terrimesophilobacter mesophilus TaxID=433647 RepID=A0A4R8V8V3_9MICO|nr:alpha-ketoacid dehydrogenase subunit alpha/beta [Terrimesophilobacter mesophilus]MBB5632759.1 2-oxoisovalerate dehydrogenase E1 component [Terrimesophilobacter mesophilus]TFB79554.1 transketolase [Terrimesophilobacter mesophilus]